MKTANFDNVPAIDQARLLCDEISILAESPVWDERRQILFWCDILGRKVRSAGLGGVQYREWAFPETVSSLGLCQSDDLIVACGMSILILTPESGEVRTLHSIPAPDGIACRLNDGRVGPDGAFWVGTMHNVPLPQMQPHGELWRVTKNAAERVQTGLTCPNGLAFSQDGSVMWQSDSVQKWIRKRKFDKTNGVFDEGVLVAQMEEETGRPDGGCLDSSGRYWSAGVSAGVLNIFSQDGSRQIGTIKMPVPHPTMPCFGGPDFGSLFVTSHRHNMTEERLGQVPLSGGVWVIPSDIKGFPAFRFDDGA
ncbi:SMP-30/gluconolactonase/LRE family protein [Rhizobium nepotum]|uniref:Calcium-binding protein n=1 Tax=Rhizobium nepotum 39/7 TaxID=1368418 RepID=A0ABR5CY04_9HYPH|nr:SMP-30/gluconolactonase/LRE family protein [Rhizobium nepotum]KJF69720.1 calcium-binding protein [Rhizobium nepotum 39/7]